MFPRLPAIDFYQYWGVSAIRRLSDYTLGSPYRNARAYYASMADQAVHSDQPKLQAVHELMTTPGFTATPLLYMLFGAFPANYTRAVALFQTLQVILFLAGVFLLGMVYRYQAFPLFCLAVLLLLGSGPVFADLRVGNVGCFQFAALAVLLALADRLERSPRATVLGCVVLTGLVLLVLAKPNVALVAPVMAVHLWRARGGRFLAIAAVPAALLGAAAGVSTCLYFQSWTVWHDWYTYIYGHNPRAMVGIPTIRGNYSTSRLLARWLHTDVWIVGAVLAAALGVSAIAVIAPTITARGGPYAMLRAALERVLGNARLAMAIGITLTIALPPLVWFHYEVIALVPGLWLLNATLGSSYVPLSGLAALVLSSGLLNVVLLPLGWRDAAEVAVTFSWIPLWAGILLQIATASAEEPRAAVQPSSPNRDDRRTAEAQMAQRPRRPRTSPRG
ncbi:MAG TPA: hypothetical protein VMS64_23065 [Candidatus Methylomirabilis sp.]|nr:hypothetical protein [Candidatus Methylomirabilis sp.]